MFLLLKPITWLPFWSSRGWDLRAVEAVLLHIPRILSMGWWWLGGTHLLPKCLWSAREKSLEILRHGWELNPSHGEDRQWDALILPLSYHDRPKTITESQISSLGKEILVTTYHKYGNENYDGSWGQRNGHCEALCISRPVLIVRADQF